MPVPVKAPVMDEALAAFEAKVRVSVSGPVAVGAKTPAMAHVPPAASDVPDAHPLDVGVVTVKSLVFPEAT
jgi:hypothetical protein